MRRSAGSGRRRRIRSRACSSISRTSCRAEERRHERAARSAGRCSERDRASRLNGEPTSSAGARAKRSSRRPIALGVAIPRLCYKPGYRARRQLPRVHGRDQGRARARAVVLPRSRRAGMEVSSNSARAVHSQKMIVELLASDMPERAYKTDSELDYWQRDARHRHAALRAPRAARRRPVASGDGRQPRRLHPVHALRARVPRGAGERRHRLRVSRRRIRRSCSTSTIRWALSTCVACGECVQACPTGALAPAHDAFLQPIDRKVASVCPYCGVGCQITYNIQDNHIVHVEGRDGPANHERLCVKGRFGFDYVQPSAPADEAADPQAGRPEVRRLHRRSRRIRSRCSAKRRGTRRSQLAGGALARIRDTRGPQRARRIRLGEGQQRGSVSVPEARPHRLSARTTSTTARGFATRRASRRCSKASARARCRTR